MDDKLKFYNTTFITQDKEIEYLTGLRTDLITLLLILHLKTDKIRMNDDRCTLLSACF